MAVKPWSAVRRESKSSGVLDITARRGRWKIQSAWGALRRILCTLQVELGPRHHLRTACAMICQTRLSNALETRCDDINRANLRRGLSRSTNPRVSRQIYRPAQPSRSALQVDVHSFLASHLNEAWQLRAWGERVPAGHDLFHRMQIHRKW